MSTEFKNRTIVSNNVEKNFSIISNEILLSNLKHDTFRVLVFMLNQSKDYVINTTYIAKLFNIDKNRMAKLLKELESAGYLKRERLKNGSQFVGWNYLISNFPTSAFPEVGISGSRDFLKSEFPESGNPDTNNTNINNNKEIILNKEKEENGDGVEVTDISTSEKIESIEPPTPSQKEIKNSNINYMELQQNLIQLFIEECRLQGINIEEQIVQRKIEQIRSRTNYSKKFIKQDVQELKVKIQNLTPIQPAITKIPFNEFEKMYIQNYINYKDIIEDDFKIYSTASIAEINNRIQQIVSTTPFVERCGVDLSFRFENSIIEDEFYNSEIALEAFTYEQLLDKTIEFVNLKNKSDVRI